MKRSMPTLGLTTLILAVACSRVTTGGGPRQPANSASARIGHEAPAATFPVSAIGHDKHLPKIDSFTRQEIAHLRSVLTPQAWQDLRFAYLQSGAFVVFTGGLHRSRAASQSLLDCYENPPCHHYCPVFVVFYMNDTSVLPSEAGRCADSLTIWKKA